MVNERAQPTTRVVPPAELEQELQARLAASGPPRKTGRSRPRGQRSRFRAAMALTFALMLPALMIAGSLTTALAAPLQAIDDQGADDEPGQKDLNFLTVDYAPGPANTIVVTWGWDDTATTGNNTRDACTLFDTDGDGFANVSFCIIVATSGATTTALYACTADSKADRCAGNAADTTYTSTGIASIVANSDPFGVPSSPAFVASHLAGNACDANPGCNTDDTVGTATVKLADFGETEAFLLNVCSYPSNQPNSDPSDCIFQPDSGFLTIVKDAGIDESTDFVFSLGAGQGSQDGTTSWTLTGSDSVSLISFASGTGYDLSEAVPSGWFLDDVSCEIQTEPTETATGTAGATPALGPTNAGITNFEIRSGLETICTFVDIEADPELTLEKSITAGDPYDTVGGTISYSYLVTNTGNVSLTGPVTIADDKSTDESCPAVTTVGNLDNELDPGESITCTATHTVTQADIDAGSVTNKATASADGTTSNEDTATANADQNPALTIDKATEATTYDSVGDVIDYTITVTNTGNVTLHDVDVSDDLVTDLDCEPDVPVASLAPGASIDCTASHTITQADIDAGSVANSACAEANELTDPVCDDVTVPGDQNPALTIDKTATPSTYDSVGDVISYEFEVENTGNVRLAGPVTIDDDKATDESCPNVDTVGNNDGFLDPGESITCIASYTIVQADITNGSVTNVATASADGTTSNEDQETVTSTFVPDTGRLMHTGTTCQQYTGTQPPSGLAGTDIDTVQYSVKSGKVSQANPGVFFYFTTFEAPSSSFTVDIDQSIDGANTFTTLFDVHQAQVNIFNADCSAFRGARVASASGGEVKVNFTSATAGNDYIVQIKYTTKNVVGKAAPSPTTVHYDFQTLVNGGLVDEDPEGLSLVKK